jgi:hypothetical protein
MSEIVFSRGPKTRREFFLPYLTFVPGGKFKKFMPGGSGRGS